MKSQQSRRTGTAHVTRDTHRKPLVFRLICRGSHASRRVLFWSLLLLCVYVPIHGDAGESLDVPANGLALERAKHVAKELLSTQRTASPAEPVQPLVASLNSLEEVLDDLQKRVAAGEKYTDQVEQLKAVRTALLKHQKDVISAQDSLYAKLRGTKLAARESRLDAFRKHLDDNMAVLKQRLDTVLQHATDVAVIGQASRSALTQLRQPTKERLDIRKPQPQITPATSPIEPLQPKLEPATRAWMTRNGSQSSINEAKTQPLVTNAEDLQPPPDCRTGDGKFPPEVEQLATVLNHSPLLIYQHVRNHYRFEIYFGARKGCVATLQTSAGNDYDLATLLVSLMRTSGVPARYVSGQVDLSVTEANGWLGVTDARIANVLLNFGGIDTTSFTDAGNTILFHRINRLWVKVLGEKAVMLDPAYKLQTFQPGIGDIPDQVAFNENDCGASPPGYLCQIQRELPYEYYREQVRQYLQTDLSGSALADVPYKGEIVPDESNSFPETLPYTQVQVTDEFSQLPSSLHHRAVLTVRGEQNSLIQAALDLPVAAGGDDSAALVARKTVSFVPATPDDQGLLDLYGGLEKTPCGLVDLIPRLRVEGQIVGTGTSVPSCSLMTWSIDLLPAGDVPPSCGNGVLDAGGEQCDDGNHNNGNPAAPPARFRFSTFSWPASTRHSGWMADRFSSPC